jgi:hypothetical protein
MSLNKQVRRIAIIGTGVIGISTQVFIISTTTIFYVTVKVKVFDGFEGRTEPYNGIDKIRRRKDTF